MTEIVRAERLAKRYGHVQAVTDVSFTVAEGETLCLLGPNGAGKSTTVRMLSTLTRPDRGSAWVAGYDIANQARQVRAAIGYVAQQAGTDGYLTGRENLLVQAAAQQLGRSAARQRTEAMLRMMRLEDAADRQVRTYSGGMRRRLEIAMGMVHDPRLLFLDEPTTGLDPEARADLWAELGGIAKSRGLSMVLTTHYLDEVDHLADRVLIVDRGKVVVEGTPKELKSTVAGDTVTANLAGSHSADAVEAIAVDCGVSLPRVEGGVLRARAEHGDQVLPMLVSRLAAAGFPIQSASVARPTLEDVYLHYVGHRFDVEVTNDVSGS